VPLLPIILERGILNILRTKPASPAEAARMLSESYADYARNALSFGTPASFTGQEARQMARVMAKGFQNPETGTPSRGGGGIIGGITAFWLQPPVAFGYGPASLFAGAPALGSCMQASFPNPRVPEGLAAKKLANCLDKSTRLVFTVGISGPQPLV